MRFSKFFFLSAVLCLGARGVPATYEVPVKDAALKPYATFDLRAFIGTEGSEEVIRYALPLELTGGEKKSIYLKRTAASPSGATALYEGLQGEASCMVLSRETMCTINYPKMKLNPQAVKQYLADNFAGDPALPFLQDVAAAFGSEPVGILRVPRSNRIESYR